MVVIVGEEAHQARLGHGAFEKKSLALRGVPPGLPERGLDDELSEVQRVEDYPCPPVSLPERFGWLPGTMFGDRSPAGYDPAPSW